MNELFSIKSTRGSQRSTGNVDQVCFWGIATPVTRKRDPTMTLHRSSGGVTPSKCPNSRQRFQRRAAFLWIDPGPPLRFHPGLNLSGPTGLRPDRVNDFEIECHENAAPQSPVSPIRPHADTASPCFQRSALTIAYFRAEDLCSIY